MISYDEALLEVEKLPGSILPAISVPVKEAVGYIAAEEIVSPLPNPPFRNSAMDGFAVLAANTEKASDENPLRLAVSGSIAAGDNPESDFSTITAVEIMTGAIVPKDFDAVIKIEDVELEKNSTDKPSAIIISKKARTGDNIRDVGTDIKKGEIILSAGTRIDPSHVLIMATAGIHKVNVHKKPLIAVLATGSELAIPESVDQLPPGKIYNSCLPFLLSLIERCGAECCRFEVLSDDQQKFRNSLLGLSDPYPDLIISTGAVSKGRYDFIPKALKDLEAKFLFHRIAIQPGKPMLCSHLEIYNRSVPFFGLPGNPISVFTGFRFLIWPYLERLLAATKERSFQGILQNGIRKRKQLKKFYLGRVSLEDGVVKASVESRQRSYMVGFATRSNAWIVTPPGIEELSPGESVECKWLFPH